MFDTMFLMSETTAKGGIERLDVMVHLMPLLNGENLKGNLNRFKSYLVSQLKRGITPQEELGLVQAIHDYIISEPATNERLEAMENLFGLKFLED